MRRDLPQICHRCRNRGHGGKPRMPECGTFRKVPGRCHDWRWICHECQPPGQQPHQSRSSAPSWLERQVAPVLASTGHVFKQEHWVGGYRFDFAIPSLMLLVEADSRAWHHRPSQLRRDRMKDKAASDLGWKVVRVRQPDICGKVRAAVDLRAEEMMG